MATSTPGVGSGLDVNAIVNQLVAVERRPLQTLQQRATVIQSQVSSWGKLKSQLDTLNAAAAKLASPSTWTQATVSSSDATVATARVTSAGGSAAGRYSVQVNQLAQEQSLASRSITAGTDLRGRLTIELGAFDSATPPAFTPRAGSTALQLDFTNNPTTLADVRAAINAAQAGVTASIITDGAGERLVISGSSTGAQNGFRISVSDPAGVGATALSELAYDGTAGSAMSLTRAPRDASFSINGLALSSASNTLDSTIQGLSIDLLKAGSTIDLTVSVDAGAQKKAIEEFVTAYNAVNSQISTDTAYDAASKKGGPLFGDAGALAVRRALRDMIGQSSTASTAFSRLPDLGLDIRRDGSIAINATALSTALAKPVELAKLMAAAGDGTESSRGLGVRLKAVIDPMLSDSGVVDSRSESLRDRLRRNQTDQERLNDRVEATRQRLLKVYQSLDGRIAQFSALGNYVNQQFGGNQR